MGIFASIIVTIKMSKLRPWVEASRLKTLPLALASPLMGSFFAYAHDTINWWVFSLTILTTLLLQILSNIANDYGDFQTGADSQDRIGPRRMVQSGEIKPAQMKKGIIVVVVFTLISGIALILSGIGFYEWEKTLVMFAIGLLALTAAIKYTAGKNPYGYRGLGDISVFLFFGLAGVLGTYFLHTGYINPWLLLPAGSIGLLSAGVLNLNNMRDFESDMKAHKRTLVVWMGNKRAKYYHMALISGSVILGSVYVIFNYQSTYQFLFLLSLPLLIKNIVAVFRYSNPIELYPELKRLALSTLFFALTFGVGEII